MPGTLSPCRVTVGPSIGRLGKWGSGMVRSWWRAGQEDGEVNFRQEHVPSLAADNPPGRMSLGFERLATMNVAGDPIS